MKDHVVLFHLTLKKLVASFMAVFLFIPGLFSGYTYLLSDESYDFPSEPSYVRSEYDVAAAVNASHTFSGDALSEAKRADFYVSVSGSDTNSGTSESEPFATLAAARDAARSLKNSLAEPRDIVVLIRGGTYYCDEPTVFGAEDSGADGFEIIYRNYPNETPVFDGGVSVTGWSEYRDGIYVTDLPEGTDFRTISENGKRAYRARYPDSGYLHVSENQPAQTSDYCTPYIVYDGEAELDALAGEKAAEVFVFPGGVDGHWNWSSAYCPITSVDTATDTLHIDRSMGCGYPLGAGSRYFVCNSLSLLNCEGEFYFDSEAVKLYYKPYNNSSLESGAVSVALTDTVISVTGESYTDAVKNIRFEGLLVQGTDETGNTESGAIEISNSENITVADCVITSVGAHGVYGTDYNRAITVSGCLIYDCGHTGIQINGKYGAVVSTNHLITNNLIMNTGALVGHGAGVQIVCVSFSEISHNRVEGTPRYALSIKGNIPTVGSTVYPEGYGKPGVTVTEENIHELYYSNYNKLEYNELSNAMYDTQDGGAIEMFCSGKGNAVRGNIIHDINIYFSFGFGIYIDDNNIATTVENNLIYRMGHALKTESSSGGGVQGAIFAKYEDNRIFNNFIADCDAQSAIYISDYFDELAQSAAIGRNIVYECKGSNDTVQLIGTLCLPGYHYPRYSSLLTIQANGNDWSRAVSECDKNLMFATPLPDTPYKQICTLLCPVYSASDSEHGKLEIDDWRSLTGFDKNTLTADPMFIDPTSGDYRLLPNSPAFSLGIEQIDLSAAGLTSSFLYNVENAPAKLFVGADKAHAGDSFVRLSVGESTSLTVFARTKTGCVLNNATFDYSTDSPCVSVTADGVITALTAGTAEITVKSAGVSTVFYAVVE